MDAEDHAGRNLENLKPALPSDHGHGREHTRTAAAGQHTHTYAPSARASEAQPKRTGRKASFYSRSVGKGPFKVLNS